MADVTLIGHSQNLFHQAQRIRTALRSTLNEMHGPRPEAVKEQPGGMPQGVLSQLASAGSVFDECEKMAEEIRHLTDNSDMAQAPTSTIRGY